MKLLGQRWYDAEVGRFISRDPIGEEGGLNLYVYVGNNVVNGVDPNGKIVYECGGKGFHGYIAIRPKGSSKFTGAWGFRASPHSLKEFFCWVNCEVIDEIKEGEVRPSDQNCRPITKDDSYDRCVKNLAEGWKNRTVIKNCYNYFLFNCYDWRQSIEKSCGITFVSPFKQPNPQGFL